MALDTTTEALALALQTEGGLICLSLHQGYRHGETLTPWIERLLREGGITPRELNLIIAGIGPGSYTGIRIGLATAKGLAMGVPCPLVGVCSLDARAWGFRNFEGTVLVSVDAKREQVYAALYRGGRRSTGPRLVSIRSLLGRLDPSEDLLLTGPNACALLPLIDASKRRKRPILDPDSTLMNPHSLLEKGLDVFEREGQSGYNITPLYLKKSEAEIKLAGERAE
jgi:tRNA threonylcarbamoyladenosine biosynthesis protein TsaB